MIDQDGGNLAEDHSRFRNARRRHFRKLREYHGEDGLSEHFSFAYKLYTDRDFFGAQFPVSEERKRYIEIHERRERLRAEEIQRFVNDPALRKMLGLGDNESTA